MSNALFIGEEIHTVRERKDWEHELFWISFMYDADFSPFTAFSTV